MRARERIAVTGLGAVSAFGEGPDALWKALAENRTGIAPIERFDTSGFASRLAATVRDFEPRKWIPVSAIRRLDLVSRYAVPAAAQALSAAAPASNDRVGVVLGTNSAGAVPVAEMLGAIAASGPAAAPPILFPYTVANAPASQCALILGLRGPNLTIAQKECSSASAIATACQVLASGGAEGIVTGGSDEVSVHVFEAFDRLGVLSRERTGDRGGQEGSRPFDATRNGFVCGEGSYALYLETESRARARGAIPLAFVEGTGLGRSPVRPHAFPNDAAPLGRAVAAGLDSAGIGPGEIDAVFASANSTPLLDATEARGLREVFEGAGPAVCSVRGAIGESGGGGAASALAACFAMREGILPGTAGLATPDPGLGLSVSPRARAIPLRRVLVTGFASGGAAAALVLCAP